MIWIHDSNWSIGYGIGSELLVFGNKLEKKCNNYAGTLGFEAACKNRLRNGNDLEPLH